MEEENKGIGLLNLFGGITIPDWVTKNVITALGKGVFGLVTEVTDLPKNLLVNLNKEIILKGEIKRTFLKKASEEYMQILDGNISLAERALKSNGIKLIQEQLNKDNVAAKTIKSLQSPELVKKIGTSEEEINVDWLTAFWNLASTKSDEDVQEILGKILADEILKPKSISLHTLQTLSILSSRVGDAFRRLSNISIDDGNSVFVIHPHIFSFQNIGPLKKYNISFNDLLDLDGAGLIRSAEAIAIQYGNREMKAVPKIGETNKYNVHFREINYAGKEALLNISGQQLSLIYFTNAGKELRRLIELKPLDNFTEEIKRKLGDNFKIK